MQNMHDSQTQGPEELLTLLLPCIVQHCTIPPPPNLNHFIVTSGPPNSNPFIMHSFVKFFDSASLSSRPNVLTARPASVKEPLRTLKHGCRPAAQGADSGCSCWILKGSREAPADCMAAKVMRTAPHSVHPRNKLFATKAPKAAAFADSCIGRCSRGYRATVMRPISGCP